MGRYNSFWELQAHEVEGKDYLVRFCHGRTGVAVIAPHGGGIEPGTTEIAEAVAVGGHSFYSFCGLKSRGNGDLHITSARFDEPVIVEMAKELQTIVAIHGCRGEEAAVYVGGRDWALRKRLEESLNASGFLALEDPRFPGTRPENICNRTRSGRGVQLEISTGLRRLIFEDFAFKAKNRRTEHFPRLIGAVKGGLSVPQESGQVASAPYPPERAETDLEIPTLLRPLRFERGTR